MNYFSYLVVFYTCVGLLMVSGLNQAQKESETKGIPEELQLQSTILEMQKQMKALKDQMQHDRTELQGKVNQLTEENTQLKSEVSRVTSENTVIQGKVSRLTAENKNIQGKVSRLTKENTELRQDLIELNDSMTVYISHTPDKHKTGFVSHTPDKHNTGFVSFTAWATEVRDYNEVDVVLFDGIVNNYGGHYDPSTSLFTCPYTGYYMFSVAVLTDTSGSVMSGDIMLNDTYLVTARAQDNTDIYDHASNMVVSLCETGQTVWIRSRGNDRRMYGSSYRYSTFSGTLLRIQ